MCIHIFYFIHLAGCCKKFRGNRSHYAALLNKNKSRIRAKRRMLGKLAEKKHCELLVRVTDV